MVNYLSIIKSGVELISSTTVTSVVAGIVKKASPDNMTKLQKVSAAIGTVAISTVLGDLSGRYFNDQIDQVAKRIKEVRNPSPIDEIETEASEEQ